MTAIEPAREYQLSDAAEADLADILIFTARRWSVLQAEVYLDGMVKAFDGLLTFPRAARERSEFDPPVRIAHFKSHIIIYRFEQGIVLIDRILHANSNWHAVISGNN